MLQIKTFIKFFFSRLLTLKFLERLSQNIIWRKIMAKKRPKIVSSATGKLNPESWDNLLRHKVWEKVPEYIHADKDVLYMEFGVWKGDSIKYFAEKFKSEGSEFYGFDTFTGMPEGWRHMEKGHYDLSGNPPKVADGRIKFVKGLFQDSLPEFMKNLKPESKKKIIIVHLDAVLHSSTLFTLFKLDEYINSYYFIFDQLGTDECRAFNSFNESKIKDYDLYLSSMWNHGPEVVFGKYKN
tara:strand:+ start:1400 stop:2116 length:717 start_codon:yes stop_codon:yes gene_type:complete